MKTYQEAFTVREDKGKAYWTKIGVSFPNKEEGSVILLDAMPASVDGRYKIVLMPVRDKPAEPPDEAA